MHNCHEALHGVEWDTLLFFAALFVVVEGVGELGAYMWMCIDICIYMRAWHQNRDVAVITCMHARKACA